MAVEEFELELVSLVLVLEASGPVLQVVVFHLKWTYPDRYQLLLRYQVIEGFGHC